MLLPRITKPVALALILFVGTIILSIATVLVFAALHPGPSQPIPFSHRIHVSTKNINCFFCHSTATRSANAGMPSVEKCRLCHNVIVAQWEPVARIHDYYERGESIPWVRANRLPEHVNFSHQAHLARRIDCGRCHGNIGGMDRVKAAHKFDMNFCITCHWEQGASTDCYTCHY